MRIRDFANLLIFLMCLLFPASTLFAANIFIATGAGANHSIFIKTGGSLWAMGDDSSGELGDGQLLAVTSPEGDYGVDVPIKILSTGAKSAAVGYYYSLFVKTDGSLWGMGGSYSNVPELIISNKVAAVSAGYGNNLFIETNGSVWSLEGEGGAGEILSSNVTAIASGNGDNYFIKTDGTLWGMGNNSSGELGIGTDNQTSVPVQIASNVLAVAAGNGFCLFLETNGSLWAMGDNEYGELDDGTYNSTNKPEQVVPGNVVAISAGFLQGLFIKSDGSLWGMGDDFAGQLGNGDFDSDGVDFPVEIAQAPPSSLNIMVSGNQAGIFFSGGAQGLSLEMTTNLTTGPWVTVTNAIPVSGFLVTNVTGTAFYQVQ